MTILQSQGPRRPRTARTAPLSRSRTAASGAACEPLSSTPLVGSAGHRGPDRGPGGLDLGRFDLHHGHQGGSGLDKDLIVGRNGVR